MGDQQLSQHQGKKGYSEEELAHIFALGKFLLAQGETKRAQVVFEGLHEIAPTFTAALLGLAACTALEGNPERQLQVSEQAHRIDIEDSRALLYYICALLNTEDMNTAGALLGEIGERVEDGTLTDVDLNRFYRSQLLRYQAKIG